MRKILIFMVVLLVAVTGCVGTGQQAAMEKETPQLLMSKDANFFVYDYMDRHYVVGSEKMSQSFAEHGHLPYTKTILGAGPHGETVVYEVAKKDPSLVERLMQTYESTPFLVECRGDNYAVFKIHGRLYVVGEAKMKEFFAEHGHLPYTKTILGAGPAGETVVFQVDKKEPKLLERLLQEFGI